MTDNIKEEEIQEEVKDEKDPKKKKGILGKLKEATEDKEEQLAILSTFVRLGILVWSGGILTLAYIKLPPALGIPEQKLDPTFIASVFTGVLATFGVSAGKKNGGGAPAITKQDMEKLMEKANQTAPAQTVRIEHAPLKFTTVESEPPVKPTV